MYIINLRKRSIFCKIARYLGQCYVLVFSVLSEWSRRGFLMSWRELFNYRLLHYISSVHCDAPFIIYFEENLMIAKTKKKWQRIQHIRTIWHVAIAQKRDKLHLTTQSNKEICGIMDDKSYSCILIHDFPLFSWNWCYRERPSVTKIFNCVRVPARQLSTSILGSKCSVP